MFWILMFPIILASSLKPFVYKELTKYIENIDIIIIKHFIFHFFALCLLFYILLFDIKKGKLFVDRIKKLPRKMYFILSGIVVISVISSLSYYYLIKTTEINRLTHIFRGGSAILIIIFSYLFYKDILSLYKIIGIILIIAGIYLVNNF